METVILILCSIALLTYSFFAIKAKISETKERNKETRNPLTQAWNWLIAMIWPAYVAVFGAGLILNNLI